MTISRSLLAISIAVGITTIMTAAEFNQQLKRPVGTVRIATFNVSMSRRQSGQLVQELQNDEAGQIKKIARIIQKVRPDVLLLNEFDFVPENQASKLFAVNYLNIAQGDAERIDLPHAYSSTVNTGLPSTYDFDNDGKKGGAADAFGFGYFSGQYGMLVLSRFPIDRHKIRTFQTFRWTDMPGALRPNEPNGSSFYSDDEWAAFRLSSKSHWDVPINIGNKTIHLLAFHPTPPVFDGKEDRNGCRNHDEIRFWADYIDSKKSGYIYDDQKQRGGLSEGASFVIAGDANADPLDGDSRSRAINQLLNHPRVNNAAVPSSPGGLEQAKKQAGKNLLHRGDPAFDTADFGDQGRGSGNLRIDYVLPSAELKIAGAGVFWPPVSHPDFELVAASDHRLVWIDVKP